MDRRQFLGVMVVGFGASPSVVRAQKSSVPVVGFISAASSDGYAYLAAAFRQGLQESGFVVGQNLEIEYRWGEGHPERLPALAAELVQRRVSVIGTGGGSGGPLVVKQATATIPIVFVTGGGDPVKEGLVASLNRPGGNVTRLLSSRLRSMPNAWFVARDRAERRGNRGTREFGQPQRRSAGERS